MEEKINIFVRIEDKDKMGQWERYKCNLEMEFGQYGKLIGFKVPNDNEYNNIIKFLEVKNITYHILGQSISFHKGDRENAEIYKFNSGWTDIKNRYLKAYMKPSNIYCKECGNLISEVNGTTLIVDYIDLITKFNEENYILTNFGYEGIIINEKLKEFFIQNNITGAKFFPVYNLGECNDIIEGFYHLKLEEGIGKLVEPFRIMKAEKCKSCGEERVLLASRLFYFKRETWNGSDIFLTKNWFNSLIGPKQRCIIISKKVYDILPLSERKKHNIARPSCFID